MWYEANPPSAERLVPATQMLSIVWFMHCHSGQTLLFIEFGNLAPVSSVTASYFLSCMPVADPDSKLRALCLMPDGVCNPI